VRWSSGDGACRAVSGCDTDADARDGVGREAMHDDMAGFYEIRVRGNDRRNHRLFCLLERNADDLGGSSIVCIDGLSKPVRQAAAAQDYRRAQRYRDEFRQHRTVAR
jgi:hypothetical protein